MDEKMIGENILEALRKKGMNQAELAEKIGKTQVTVSRYVNGHRAPKAGTLKAIADTLGTTTDALMKDNSSLVAINKTMDEDNEIYILTPGAVLIEVLKDYGIETNLSGKVADHIVDDFMDELAKIGYLEKGEDK